MNAEFLDWFSAKETAFAQWGEFVVETIKARVRADIGDARYASFFKIEPSYRVKVIDSIKEKLERKKYSHPHDEMTDLVGARFVVLLRSDIDVLDRVILNRSCWSVSKDRDYINETLSDPSVFDYQSMHYLVRNPATRILADVEIPEGLACEVQVRSLLQHAYAELVHDDIYKADVFVHEGTKRLVARSMALMESTDGIFVEISRELENIRSAQTCLFEAARLVYRDINSDAEDKPTELYHVIADTYRDALKEVSQRDLNDLMKDHRRRQQVRNRALDSCLFSDPACVLVYWLTANRTRRTFREWPRDDLRKDLEQIAADLGIAPQ
ncbi:hypothetical protein G9Q38_07255 [Pusillimonas sp. DMV24BSW_D]|uniref:GTP pyrophosphokinase n=1 Tax=Neopusillimonas aestuarii TaxID=2716226 RepID=UPI00140D2F2E|nr:hypothetical protein [Pusillimonas sp. DMV24BSW_D]QIM48992.1 hypothetical protein G9Q38_07255 [Pusillimonas sp. DMV24BSW_D]